MLKILLPVDGSENSNRAVKHLIHLIRNLGAMEVHVVNVQPELLYINILLKPRQEVIDVWSQKGRKRRIQFRLRPTDRGQHSLRFGIRLRRGCGNDCSACATLSM
jgi:nucleotide-binding universal stress UspA family protein